MVDVLFGVSWGRPGNCEHSAVERTHRKDTVTLISFPLQYFIKVLYCCCYYYSPSECAQRMTK